MSNAVRKELHALVDALPASEEQAARRYLEYLRDASDPYASMDRVEPLLGLADDERAKLHASLLQAEAEIAAGKSVAAEDLVREPGGEVKVRVSPTAHRQLSALAAWWNQNRASSRVRVEDALEAAVSEMADHPGLGPTYSRDPKYRIWRLKGTPYVLFYRVDDAAETIWVVVAWSALRGSGPVLP